MNDTFLKACRGEKTEYTPIWMMRQAGRLMPDYRRMIEKYDFLTICRTPELAAEVTIQPVNVLGVDAAIYFSDILTTVAPMGMDLIQRPGKGLCFTNPVRGQADIDNLKMPEPREALSFVYEAQKMIVRELRGKVPVIGFAGSPFTVAAWMIEGVAQHSFIKTKNMIYQEPRTFHNLMRKVTSLTTGYLTGQAEAGAQALMLFDSFAGVLSPLSYLEYNLYYVKRIIADLKKTGVPVIYFGSGQHGALHKIKSCGADVIGVDYGLNLEETITQLGSSITIQGNLEPFQLFRPRDRLAARAHEILGQGRKARAHIFNLGHGVPPGASVENARALVEIVHEWR